MKRKADGPVTRSASPGASAPTGPQDPVAAVPNFIAKTYAMVQDPTNAKAVRWNAKGTALVIDHVRVVPCTARCSRGFPLPYPCRATPFPALLCLIVLNDVGARCAVPTLCRGGPARV